LSTDGDRLQAANLRADGSAIWTETSVGGAHPFTEDEAEAEFERWRV
jgi:hypothetical protein